MLELLIIIISVIAVGWIGCLIITEIDDYLDYRYHMFSDIHSDLTDGCSYHLSAYKIPDLPELSFEKFKDFYSINPDGWDLKQGIAYKKDQYGKYISAIAFRPYSNYKKYEKFRNQIEKNKEDIRIDRIHNELLTIALEDVQKDINNLKIQANKELEQARFTIEQLFE